MAIFRHGFVLVCGLVTALVTSQAPEFAQQYRQRLGGAVDELRKVVDDFDRDATDNGLTRERALQSYRDNAQAFFRDRGTSMNATLDRYAALARQEQDFARLPPFLRPLALLETRDGTVAQNAWRDYEPAVPVTAHGFGWAAIGLAIGGVVAWLFSRLMRWGWRGRPQYGYRGARW